MSAQIPASEPHLNEVFDWWYKHDRNFSKTADNYGHNRKTIWKWAVKHDWIARADQIATNVAKGIDRRITKEILSNIKLAEACLKKECAAYLHAGHKATGNLQHIVALFKYIDEVNQPNEIADAIRDAARLDDVPYDPDLATEVRDLLDDVIKETEGKFK